MDTCEPAHSELYTPYLFFHGLDNLWTHSRNFLETYYRFNPFNAWQKQNELSSSLQRCCQRFLKEEPQLSVVTDCRKPPVFAAHNIQNLKVMGILIFTWPTSFYIWGPGTSNNQVPRPLKKILESSLCPCQKNLRIKELWLFFCPPRTQKQHRHVSAALCIWVHGAHFLISAKQFVQSKFNICPHSW